MSKKVNKLTEPNMRLYFLLAAVFCAVTLWIEPILGLVEAGVMALTYVYFRRTAQKRREGIQRYVEDMTDDVASAVGGVTGNVDDCEEVEYDSRGKLPPNDCFDAEWDCNYDGEYHYGVFDDFVDYESTTSTESEQVVVVERSKDYENTASGEDLEQQDCVVPFRAE